MITNMLVSTADTASHHKIVAQSNVDLFTHSSEGSSQGVGRADPFWRLQGGVQLLTSPNLWRLPTFLG
jgi:hypothetical protein